MRRLRFLSAWLLLALWLPVTLHCDLETAGLMGGEGCCAADEQACANDGCTEIESGHFKSGNHGVKVPAPALTLDLRSSIDLFSPQARLTELRQAAPPRDSFARPLDWVSEWRFVRRQALPARAPDSRVA